MWAIACLVITSSVIYLNSLPNPLIRDDLTAVVNDRRANEPKYWRDIFTQRYWHGLNSDPIYRPLTTLSFLVNRMATGTAPEGYRVVNIALHAAVCLAVWMVGLLVIGDRWAAWIAAMLFAVHTLHTEAVIVIVGRADMAVTLLLLLVTGLLLRRPPDRPTEAWRWALIVLLCATAMFCKETAVAMVPLVGFVQAWQWWTHSRSLAHRRQLASEVLLFLSVVGVLAGTLLIRYALFGQISRPGRFIPIIDNPLGRAAPAERALTALGLFGRYLRLILWPDPLSCDYSYNQIPVARGLAEPAVLGGVACIVGVVAILAVSRRFGGIGAWRLAVWCVGFFAATYGMISNAVLPIGTIFGERLIYLPSVAWCWAFGAIAVAGTRRAGSTGRWMVAAAVAMVLIANTVLTVRRNVVWYDPLRLWTDAVEACPKSARAWANLSRSLEKAGKTTEAVEKMRAALAIYDSYWEDHMAMGDYLAHLGQFEDAARCHLRAYQLADEPFKVRPAYLLGQSYMEIKRPGAAIKAFKAVLSIEPNHVGSLNNLAYLQATSTDPSLRNVDEAARHIERALGLVPNALILLDTAVDVYLAQGRRDKAIETIRRALSVGDRRDPLCSQLERRLGDLTSSRPASAQANP